MSLYHLLTTVLNKSHFYRKLVVRYKRKSLKKDPLREINRIYYLTFGEYPNIENPSNLIEKIFWMELYADLIIWTKCADKYLVRDYVKECGYESYLPQLYGKWDNPNVFSIKDLPNKFIIKTNNGCGTCIIVKDKASVNEDTIRKQLKKWLEFPYGYSNSQLHYLGIPRCIIAEELLVNDEQSRAISPKSLIDYKVWCFGGKPEFIWVAYNRAPTNVKMALFDFEWKPLTQYLVSSEHYQYCPDVVIPKPDCLDNIKEIASVLSKPFQEVRVDFYILNNRPYIGELTFSTGYGYFTKEFYQYLGSKIDLSKVKRADTPNYLTL